MQRLVIMGLCYPISAFMDCTIAASRGLGRTIVPTFIVIMGSCVFRVVWVYTVFAYFGTLQSLYLLFVCSWTVTAIAEIIYFGPDLQAADEHLRQGRMNPPSAPAPAVFGGLLLTIPLLRFMIVK